MGKQQNPINVAVIGGGPGGMFFIHALNRMVKEEVGANQNINVICYERSSRPGGIWRAADSNGNNTDMYDKLWTNGCSFLIEFFDYTYDEHFHGKPATVYLKRQDLLEYLIGRVTNNCPDFFEQFFKFNSEVVHVTFDECKQKFIIRIKDLMTGNISTNEFDKCIWACGENGKPKVPKHLVSMFRDGGFQGRMIHSSETNKLEEDVKGKRVLIVGGAFSAEDITLQAIKLGVDHVFVCSRLCNSEITWTTKWPYDKVTTFLEQEPMAVSGTNCIQLREISWEFNGYKNYTDNEVSNEIHNIDTIMFCTGYDPPLNFLDKKLNKGFPGDGEFFSSKFMFDAPNNWKMSNGLFTDYTGDVPLSPKLKYLTWRVHPEFYRGVLISNPNMMFISTYCSDIPLLSLDVHAYMLARYTTGLNKIPSADEMRACNLEEAIEMLQYPVMRFQMDENYCKVVLKLPDFWPEEPYTYPEVWENAVCEYELTGLQQLAWMMEESSYPIRIGTRYDLNERAATMMGFNMLSYYHRYNLKDDIANWKTFRDYTNGDQFYSLFTGKRAVPLQERWLDIDNPISNNENKEATRRYVENTPATNQQNTKETVSYSSSKMIVMKELNSLDDTESSDEPDFPLTI
jgi:thioredoxin reductase